MTKPGLLSHSVLIAGAVLRMTATHADEMDDNPVTAAEDAFGMSIGSESIGLYDAGNVRGFDPVAAGNVRMDGMYFDQQAAFTGRLVRGSTIWVGVSSLAYPFPAPTGIVDARIRKAGTDPAASIALQVNSFGARQIELDGEFPVPGKRLAIGGGVGLYDHEFADGGGGDVISLALTPRWRPHERVEVVPFWSESDTRDRDTKPVFLTAGDRLPPEVSRSRYLGQSWAGIDRTHSNYGLLVTAAMEGWLIRTGVFRSVAAVESSYSLQFRDSRADGVADLVAVANAPRRFASSSGELRLSRTWQTEAALHRLHVSLRGRDQYRRYGGAARVELGPVRLDQTVATAEPRFSFGAQSRENTAQWTAGIAWEARWKDVGELGLSVQRADYRKKLASLIGAPPASTAAPWLYSGGGVFHLRPGLAVYGNYVRGLEDSPVAPETASNRDESPPAIRTEQTDLGLRWQAPNDLQVITGLFRLEKPHFGIDEGGLFRQLGKQQRQGLELSVSGEPFPGLHVVAGAILMDAKVTGREVERGEIAARPVASTRISAMANLDYRFASIPALSLDLAVDASGDRVASLDNALTIPAATLVDFGARYRFKAGDALGVVRLKVANVFDAWSWDVIGNSALTPVTPREISLRVTLNY